MNEHEPAYSRFGLIVTGKCEKLHAPKMFTSIVRSGWCNFKVISQCFQLSPSHVDAQELRVVGTRKSIPDIHFERIGIAARRALSQSDVEYIILIDDLEHDRRDQVALIFSNYHAILERALGNHIGKVSVHFFANMIEAYFFADVVATNSALGTSLTVYAGDVETIRHPKNELRKVRSGYDEVIDGGKVLEVLNTETVLSDSETCGFLRSLFKWIHKKIGLKITDQFQLSHGMTAAVTDNQA